MSEDGPFAERETLILESRKTIAGEQIPTRKLRMPKADPGQGMHNDLKSDGGRSYE